MKLGWIKFSLIVLALAACILFGAPSKASAVTANDVATKMNAYTNWLSSKGYSTNMSSGGKYIAKVFWNANLSTNALKKALNNGDFDTGTTTTKCPRKGDDHSYSATCHSNYFYNGRQCNGYACYFWYYLYGTDLEWGSASKTSMKYASYAAAGGLKRGDMLSYGGHYGIVDSVDSKGRIIFFHCNGLTTNYPCGITHGYWIIDDSGTELTTTKVANSSSAFIRRHRDLIDDSPVIIVDDCEIYGCSASNGSGTYICTASGGLSINKDHNYSSATGTVIPYGATVTVTKMASSATYAHVTYNGVSGIASKNYLKPYSPTSECTTYKCSESYAGYYKVSGTDGSLVLHNAHNYNNSSAIGEIKEGTIVWVTKGSTSATYRHVTYGGKAGIMSGNYLKAIPSHTLSLNANGGSVSTTSFKVWEGVGDFNDLSGYIPKRAGYSFLGWYTAASGGKQIYNAEGKCVNDGTYWSGSVWKYAGNVTLYAHWQADTVYVESITLSGNSSIYVGESAVLTATVNPSNATSQTLSWTSSDTSVATVSDGTVKAIAEGTATITAAATDGLGAEASYTVTVVPVDVETITLSETALTLIVGDSAPLKATIMPENATYKSLTWISENESVAVYDAEAGVVRAVGAGSTGILAQASGSETYARCAVTVNPSIEDISLNRYSVTLSAEGIGAAFPLRAAITPEDGRGTINWTSTNPAVAVVSEDGYVTAQGEGTAKIYASVVNGPSVSCTVKVEGGMPLMTLPAGLLTIEDEAFAGTGAVRVAVPSGAESIGSRAFADSSALRFLFIPNSVIDIAEDAFAGSKNLCLVCGSGSIAEQYAIGHDIEYVNDESASFVFVRSISMDAARTIAIDDWVNLDVTILPANASNPALGWRSSAPEIVSVSEDGTLMALTSGSAVITAEALDGSGKSASCTVTVTLPDVTVAEVKDEQRTVIDCTDATLAAALEIGGVPVSRVQKAGILLYDADNKRMASKLSDPVIEDGSVYVEASSANLGVELTAETAYRYRYAVIVSGMTYYSDYYSFTTLKGYPRIRFESDSITLTVGDQIVLSPKVEFSDSTDVSYRSSNTGVAYEFDGELYAVGTGTTVITAFLAEDPTVKATCTITVVEEVASYAMRLSDTDLRLGVGDAYQLTAAISPASDVPIQWSSNDQSVAIVNEGVVTAIQPGHALIIAAAPSLGLSQSCAVEVVEAESELPEVDEPAVREPETEEPETLDCGCSTGYAGNYVVTGTDGSLAINNGHGYGAGYTQLGEIPEGATVYVSAATGPSGVSGNWGHVTYNGVSGYSAMRYLTPAGEAVDTSAGNVNARKLSALIDRANAWADYTWTANVDLPVYNNQYSDEGTPYKGVQYWYPAGTVMHGVPYTLANSKYTLDNYPGLTDAQKSASTTFVYAGVTMWGPKYGGDCSCLANDVLWYADPAIGHDGQTYVASSKAHLYARPDWDEVAPGDLLAISGHVVVVTGVSGETLTIVESRGNGDSAGALCCPNKTPRAAGGYYVCGICEYCNGSQKCGAIRRAATKSTFRNAGYSIYRYKQLYTGD